MRATFISYRRDDSEAWRSAIVAASMIVVVAAVCLSAYAYLAHERMNAIARTDEAAAQKPGEAAAAREAPEPVANRQDAVDRTVAAQQAGNTMLSRVSGREFSAPIGILHSLAAPSAREAATIQPHCEPTYAGDSRRPGTGVLSIQSSSPAAEGAEVLLNGECQGTMNAGHLILENIPTGTYQVAIRKGLHEMQKKVRIPLRDHALEAAPKVVVNF
jgi:hypothetical protein